MPENAVPQSPELSGRSRDVEGYAHALARSSGFGGTRAAAGPGRWRPTDTRQRTGGKAPAHQVAKYGPGWRTAQATTRMPSLIWRAGQMTSCAP